MFRYNPNTGLIFKNMSALRRLVLGLMARIWQNDTLSEIALINCTQNLKKCKGLNKPFYLDLIKYLIVKNLISAHKICLNKNLFV